MVSSGELRTWFCEEVLPLEGTLMGFIARNWRNREEHLDIRQDVYERVLKGAGRDLPVNPRAYVFTTARNVIINRVRRAKVVQIEFAPDVDALALGGEWLTPARHLEGQEALQRAVEGLDRLPPRCREIVRLRKFEGIGTKEVASRLGIGIDAVQQQTMLGMRALADHMLGGRGRIMRPERKKKRSFTRPMTDHSEIERTAAEWLLCRHESDWSPRREAELEEWLAASHAHAAAFWRLEYADQMLDRFSWAEIAPTGIESPAPRRFLPKPAELRHLLAVAAILVIAVLGYWMLPLLRDGGDAVRFATYTNALGEVSQIIIPDGTRIALDSQSAIRIGEGDNNRRVELVRGRALLDVAEDPKRPFVVEAGLGDVEVLGTRFVLDRQERALQVAVLEGAVRVQRNASTPAQAVTLAPGDVATMSKAAIKLTNVDIADLERGVSWREGKVIFDSTPLAEAVAQFNRYNTRKIVIASPSVHLHQVGGVFKLGNIEGFARLMREVYGVDLKIVDPEAR